MLPFKGPEIASPVDCCQRLPVSTSLCTSFAFTMLSYSKWSRRPLSSARKTAPVPHVLHQVTSIGPSGISSSTDPCCCRSSAWVRLGDLALGDTNDEIAVLGE